MLICWCSYEKDFTLGRDDRFVENFEDVIRAVSALGEALQDDPASAIHIKSESQILSVYDREVIVSLCFCSR